MTGDQISANLKATHAPDFEAWNGADSQCLFAHQHTDVAMAGGALVIFWACNQAQGDAPLSITDPLFGRG
jgi:hypothetical protein